MLVAIIPYLFDQVESSFNTSAVQDFASVLFTINLAATLLIRAVFANVIASEEKRLVEQDVMTRFRRARNVLLLLWLLVLASLASPWDWVVLGVHVRLFIWFVPIVTFWFDRMRRPPVGSTGVPPV